MTSSMTDITTSRTMAPRAARLRTGAFLRAAAGTVGLGLLTLSAFAQGGVSPARTAVPYVAAPMVSAGPYMLAPQDQLDITVQGHEDLHQSVTVLSDGTFHFPIAGQVRAAGRTALQVEAALAQGVGKICKDPVVTVVVREGHAERISVAGEVKTPGQYDYHPGMRLLELIAACGGPTEAPELTDATLVTDGGTRSVPISLIALMRGSDATQNVALAPGDIVLFSPKDPATSMIQVVGEVVKPGQYDAVPGGTTVLSVLTEAGGASPDAALTQAQLMHAGRVTTLDLHPLKTDLRAPVGKQTLVAGDTLLIPENKQKVAVFGEVRSPAILPIPDGERLTVTGALAEAGGPTVDGDKKQVGILRLGADNQRHLTVVNVDDLLKGDGKVADRDLQPNDILVVPTRRKGHSVGEYLLGVPALLTLRSL